MESYRKIRDNLVFTYHSKDNLKGNRIDSDRTDITIHQIVLAIQRGIVGFCGSRRMKKTYKGVEVIYKRDSQGKYVVITYYRKYRKNKYRNNYKKVLTY